MDDLQIRAAITVYECDPDGNEINRRAAFPMAGLALSVRSVDLHMQRLSESVKGLRDAINRFPNE